MGVCLVCTVLCLVCYKSSWAGYSIVTGVVKLFLCLIPVHLMNSSELLLPKRLANTSCGCHGNGISMVHM